MRRLPILALALLLACSSEAPGEAAGGSAAGGAGVGGAGGGDAGGPEPLLGNWSELPPLAAPRSSFGLATVERVLYLAGGFQGSSSAITSVASYDVDAPGEISFALLPEPAAGASAFGLADSLVVVGGIADTASNVIVPHDACYRFPLGGAAGTSCSAIGNGPTSFAASAVADGRVYLFGGLRLIDMQSGSYPTKVVQRYDPAADAWTAETMLPEFRDGAAVVFDDGVAHVIGGRTLDEVSGSVKLPTEVLSYDLQEHTWASDRVAPMPTARADVACAERRGFVYCFGGYSTIGATLDTVERLELATGQWLPQAPLPQPLQGVRAAALDDAIVVVGGRDGSSNAVATVYRLE